MDIFALLQDKFGDNVSRDVRLAPYTTFKIGGPARFFFQADNPEKFAFAYDFAVKNNMPFFILGGGSNVLFPDEGFDGLVIRDGCKEIAVDGEIITAQSGVWFENLVDTATSNSLTGLEFAAGIPGNVAGAIYGNAGAFGGCIADILLSAVLYSPSSGVKIVDGKSFEFAYRHSRLKREFELILSASFRLARGKKSNIADKAGEYRKLRRAKHPDYRTEGCAGSVFKNIKEPEIIPAGRLLDEAGVRGMKMGGAEVYRKHCNIIVNNGSAKASDVRELSSMMRRMVKDKFDIDLEYEILIINP